MVQVCFIVHAFIFTGSGLRLSSVVTYIFCHTIYKEVLCLLPLQTTCRCLAAVATNVSGHHHGPSAVAEDEVNLSVCGPVCWQAM